MKKFIVIYHTPAAAAAQMSTVSPEDQAKGMEGWMNWAKKCGDKLVDLGAPLMNGQKLSPDGKSTNSQKEISGYSILQAANMPEAKSLLQGHPHISWNPQCTIEVHEAMPIPGM